MQNPKTLLQLAGVNGGPARLSEAAVVVIDVQNEYVCGKLPLAGVETALDGVARLLDAARAAGAPVIHVVHRGRAGGLFDPLGKLFQIHARAAPGPGEKIIEKELPNAFAKTALHQECFLLKRSKHSMHRCKRSTVFNVIPSGPRLPSTGCDEARWTGARFRSFRA
jgi:hypothetical protein